MHPRVHWAVTRAQSAVVLARLRRRLARDFDPDQPRDDDGKWTSGGGGGGTEKPAGSAKGGKKGKAAMADFAKDNVGIDAETRSNPDKEKKFIDTWNEHVGEAPAEFKKDFLGGLAGSMNIHYDDSNDTLSFRGYLKDKDGDNIGEYTREIDFKNNKAVSSYFKLKEGEQHSNIGKTMLKANVAMYQQMGLDSVDVHANIDIGGYAWARYGYVPTRSYWRSLSSDLDDKIDGLSGAGGGSGGYRASSWEELGDSQQRDIEQAFYDSTEQEFRDSEISSWRDGGQPLDDAKVKLADDFATEHADWADHAIDGYRKKLADEGKPDIPYTNEQLQDAIGIDYKSDGEGRNDADISFDDDQLTEPQGLDPNQPDLPGIEPVAPHERLTEDMRDGLERALSKAFDREAESTADDIEPPDYLSDNAREFQKEYWDGLSDSDKFDWAERHEPDLLGSDEPSDDEATGEMDEADADRLRALTGSGDPKALWAIADSKWGKKLLIDSDWYGTLDLRDKETMDRFNAYVGKASKAA